MLNTKMVLLGFSILLSGSVALAQESGDMQGMNMHGMKMDNMLGMHDMAATVTAIGSKAGLVDVNAGGLALKVHFPPGALANLKAGDRITLHLAFTKP